MSGEAFAFFRDRCLFWSTRRIVSHLEPGPGWHCQICRGQWRQRNPAAR